MIHTTGVTRCTLIPVTTKKKKEIEKEKEINNIIKLLNKDTYLH